MLPFRYLSLLLVISAVELSAMPVREDPTPDKVSTSPMARYTFNTFNTVNTLRPEDLGFKGSFINEDGTSENCPAIKMWAERKRANIAVGYILPRLPPGHHPTESIVVDWEATRCPTSPNSKSILYYKVEGPTPCHFTCYGWLAVIPKSGTTSGFFYTRGPPEFEPIRKAYTTQKVRQEEEELFQEKNNPLFLKELNPQQKWKQSHSSAAGGPGVSLEQPSGSSAGRIVHPHPLAAQPSVQQDHASTNPSIKNLLNP